MASLKSLESLDQYTVGWITALPLERAAATAMLDERHEKPLNFTQPSSDTNSYTWGRIAGHNIVIVSLPAGMYGTTSAATTAMPMLSSFPQIRIGLLVGIGAGIPRGEDFDIRLGDIVVSQPTGNNGGVVQYDFGTARVGDRFERKGFLNSPPQALLKALARLQAEHEFGSKVPEILAEMLQKNPTLAKAKAGKPSYAYQGQEHDRLFKSAYLHSQGNKDCKSCDPEQEIQREVRESQSPEIHYGLIASGNTLVKDASFRDSVLKELGDDCICFEMEAAGLMNSFPCLVIRGICDYADSHKNDRWQRYTAAAAAAYGKEFLGVLPGEDLEKAQRAMDVLAGISNTVQQTHSIVKNTSQQMYDERINRWLSPPDPSTNYNQALQQRQHGSGRWLLRSPQYSAWKTETNSFLWLHGIPGCGKTILSSTVLEDLWNTEAFLPLYFYFDFNDTNKQSLEKAVRSLVSQLYSKREDVRIHLDTLYSSHENGNRQPDIMSQRRTFQDMIQQVDEVWIVLDALDECQTRIEYQSRGLLPWIKSIRDSRQTNVHLLVTSRPEQDIVSAIESWARNQDIPIQDHLVKNDIRAYIHTRIRQDDGLRRFQSHQDEIEATLIEKANGMFRWVSCQLDALEDCLSPSDLREALSSMPETLDGTYARILANIPHKHKHHTRRLLQFLAYSEIPLWIEEAVDAIAVKVEGRPRFAQKDRMIDPEEISKYCSSLVVIIATENRRTGKTSKKIQLAHFSVKEYLTSDRLENEIAKDLEEIPARTSVAEVCLAYLLELDSELSMDDIRQQFPLADYSARYWAENAKVAEGSSNSSQRVFRLAMELFSNNSCSRTLYHLYNPGRFWIINLQQDQNLPPTLQNLLPALYYASAKGLVGLVKALLQKITNVKTRGRFYRCTIQALLQKNTNVKTRGRVLASALHAASFSGHAQVVQALLEKGAKIDIAASPIKRETPLFAASFEGHIRVVQVLLKKGVDVNAKDRWGTSALQAASYRGHLQVVQALLEKGADVNAKDRWGKSALRAASYKGHIQVVQVLLEKGAHVGKNDAFMDALSKGHIQIAQMLLDSGADLNRWGGIAGEAVKSALRRGRVQLVQIRGTLKVVSEDQDKDGALDPKERSGGCNVTRK